MKTDQYLTLCLDQAARSPLHYRHGCIIVRGGKVIGEGFNDYRPGFNGGALKHGRIANGTLDGSAIAELKEKLKKQKPKPKPKQQDPGSSKTFIPFEGTSNGGGHNSNIPLSMHSEMMAIHSALAASSTLSSTAFSCEKPCFKLPDSTKRKERLRREVLTAYVTAVCSAAQGSGLPQVTQYQNHNNKQLKEDLEDLDDDEEQELPVSRSFKDMSLAFHKQSDGMKHHQKQRKKEKNRQNGEYRYQYQYDRYGQQIQQHGPHQLSASKTDPKHVIRGYESTSACDKHDTTTGLAASLQHGKRSKDYKRSGKMKHARTHEPAQPEPLLLPKGHAAGSIRNPAVRKKHPRLKGADLYVARLGWCGNPANKAPDHIPVITRIVNRVSSEETRTEDVLSASTSLTSTIYTASSGSLYDELANPEVSLRPTRACTPQYTLDTSSIRASRPCYRCITYMHSVGIKRVFWTNDAGEWEGGKVRDMIDALDNSMENVASGKMGGPTGNGVFITKHEVLMLRRMMGVANG